MKIEKSIYALLTIGCALDQRATEALTVSYTGLSTAYALLSGTVDSHFWHEPEAYALDEGLLAHVRGLIGPRCELVYSPTADCYRIERVERAEEALWM
jgi:hypothetical protein